MVAEEQSKFYNMKNYLKLSVASLVMATVCINFSSCSSDNDDKSSPDTPVVVGPSNVFTGLTPKSVMGTTFTYNSNGQVIEILTQDGDKYKFTYGSGLTTRVTNPDNTIRVESEEYIFNLEIGNNGFIKYCEQTKKWKNEIDTWEFGYNSDSQLNYMKRSEGDNEVTNITYSNGDITRVRMHAEDDSRVKDDYVIEYTSESVTNKIENKGCIMLFDQTFGIDMDEFWVFYYAGLLGKATKHLPVSQTDMLDDGPYKTELYTWQLNSDGYPVLLQTEHNSYRFTW